MSDNELLVRIDERTTTILERLEHEPISSVVEVAEVSGIAAGHYGVPRAVILSKVLAAGAVEDIKTVIVALQPVVLVLIGAIAYEDGQAMKAEAAVVASKPQA